MAFTVVHLDHSMVELPCDGISFLSVHRPRPMFTAVMSCEMICPCETRLVCSMH